MTVPTPPTPPASALSRTTGAAADALESTARTFDATVTALDGEQAPAAYASAPTGGVPR